MSAPAMMADPDAATIPLARPVPREQRHARPAGVLLRRALALLTLVGAVALLWFLYRQSQFTHLDERAAMESQLRAVRQDDSDWNVDVLRTKVGLAEDYDAMVSLHRAIRERMADLMRTSAAQDSALHELLQRLDSAFSRKADAVDRFKSHNSILRNSLRYLPTAADEALTALRHTARADTREIEGLLVATLTETLKYAVVTEEAQRETLIAVLDRLAARGEALPQGGEAVEAISIFISHVRTILRQKQAEDDILLRIAGVPTVKLVDDAMKALDALAVRRTAAAEFWRIALVAYSALLLTIIAAIAWRLRLSYVELNRVNAALVTANDYLEMRVQERTRELESTLRSLRESEAQLVQSEKMSSLGQMVAGVVHEINTPLAYVRSSLELIDERTDDVLQLAACAQEMVMRLADVEREPEALAACFDRLAALAAAFTEHALAAEMQKLARDGLHGIDQIGEIVLNLRNFSRLDRSKTTLFDVREGLESTLVIARNVVKTHRLVKRFTPIPPIECAPSQLNQVFLNLITNAAQALPDSGGTITLGTAVENDMVRIEVADDGKGIEPEHLGRIFDPFFTTKPIGEGTGLGLSIAYKIVQAHGGRIAVHSTPGEGTTFTVYLPLRAVAATRDGEHGTQALAA